MTAVEPLHNHPGLYPTLPPRVVPSEMEVPNDPHFRTCWEFVLTHELTDREGSAFWHGANLAYEALRAQITALHHEAPGGGCAACGTTFPCATVRVVGTP